MTLDENELDDIIQAAYQRGATGLAGSGNASTRGTILRGSIMTDEITTTENVFEALDLPYHAKAVEILESWTLTGPVGAAIGEFDELVSAIAKALEAEREECAKKADLSAEYFERCAESSAHKRVKQAHLDTAIACRDVAFGIRNRSTSE